MLSGFPNLLILKSADVFDQYNIKTIQKITTHSKDLHVKFLFIRRVPVSVTSVSYGPRRGLGESWLRHAQ